jgi:hypothetical protein
MRNSLLATLAAASMSAAALALAPLAAALPQDVESAQDKVNELEAEGFKVIVTKVGTASLDQCTVGSVRSGQPVYKTVHETGGGSERVVDYTTVYLDARC